MCGIIGQLNQNKPIDRASFEKMRDTLRHRGPEHGDSWFSENAKIALGHRRLSFLDLSNSGEEPMPNEDGTIWLTFNGEIYNYLELRMELEQKGHHFRSRTDSEVLLHGYEEWGTDLVKRIKGMFAFGIWDDNKKQLFLVRDHFGIKPLYYAHLNNTFLFASELKAIVASEEMDCRVDYSSVCDFLAYRYVPSPKTIWQGVKKLPPAYYLVFDYQKAQVVEMREYWTLRAGVEKRSPSEIIRQVDERLKRSVEIHIRADVPIGSFLSGGYDSSAIVYYLSRLSYKTNTFSIGFENWPESEHQYAQAVADQFGMPLHTEIAGEKDLELVNKLMYHYDEPIADISIIPTYMVSKMASKYNKAVLSGEGADEIFCGYWWQKDIATNYPRPVGWKKAIKNFIRGEKSPTLVDLYGEAMAMGRWTHKNLPEILHPDLHASIPKDSEWFYKKHLIEGFSPLKSFQYLDIKTFMAELVLVKVDRASMANSLEVRVPFLDHELFEDLYNLNEHSYFKPGVTKFLLRENIKEVLPEEIINRPKQGFVGPDVYYKNIDWYARNLRDGRLIQEKIIDQSGLDILIQEKDHWRLWKLLVLESWWNNWVK